MAQVNTLRAAGTAVASALDPVSSNGGATATSDLAPAQAAESLGGSSRLTDLLTTLDKLLNEKYAFDVFAKDSINFGIMVTYRQTWEPQNYQVGDLVSTIPLAPKEIRRLHHQDGHEEVASQKELEDAPPDPQDGVERHGACRCGDRREGAEQERLQRSPRRSRSVARSRRYKSTRPRPSAASRPRQSEQVKKRLSRERAEERSGVQQQHRIEIDTSESTELEETTVPRDPEPQRRADRHLHVLRAAAHVQDQRADPELTPVILVANDVPAPNEIDDAWLVEHDWILRRSILDDSFRPALDYLTKSFVGAEVNIRHPRGERASRRRSRRLAEAADPGRRPQS